MKHSRIRFSSKTFGGMVLIIIFILFLLSVLSATLEIPESDIIFSHNKHQDLSCNNCHPDIEKSDKSQDKNLPGMDVCTECHDGETLPGECSLCHKNEEEPRALVNPERDFVFSHKSHLEREAGCSICHGDVNEKEELTSENMPDMADCYQCHKGIKVPEDCDLCHAETKFKKYHPNDWLRAHQYQSYSERERCIQCHKDEDLCQSCHQGDNLFQETHPLNYNYTHGLDAKSKEKDCLSCHLSGEFCNTCHSQEKGKPLSHLVPDWAGDKHGEAARKDMELCASCHDTADPICTWCHRDKNPGRGNDHDIHPPGFASSLDKGPWHDDSGYFCYECHTRGSGGDGGFCGYCHGSKD